MKTKSLLFFCLFAGLALFTHATAPTFTAGPEYPWRLQVDVSFNSDGSLAAASPQVFYRQDLTSGAKVIQNDTGSVQWDVVANASKTIAANGKTYTYGEIFAATVAIAAQERAAQQAAGP